MNDTDAEQQTETTWQRAGKEDVLALVQGLWFPIGDQYGRVIAFARSSEHRDVILADHAAAQSATRDGLLAGNWTQENAFTFRVENVGEPGSLAFVKVTASDETTAAVMALLEARIKDARG